MTLTTLPDVEKLVSEFLRNQAEVSTAISDRVYTAIPNNPVWPLLLVRRIGGIPRVGRPLAVDEPLVQLDAYGGTKKQAHDLAETTRAVIAERIQGTHDEGVVSWFEFGTFAWLPDPGYTPARARYIADVTLTVRPNFQ